MIQNTAKIYFSPTGNTKKSVDAMAAAVGGNILDHDVTVDRDGAPCVFTAEDFAVFGMPVYGGRIPIAARDRLLRFRGKQTPCIVLVTYGNRHYDDALVELADLVQAQGFVVKGAAALVGRHTYGDIQAGRPGADDLAADAAFARKAAANAVVTPPDIYGNRPYRDGGGGGGFRPLTSENCTACGICVSNCPMQAIGADCRTIDDSLCISCFRCIRKCPESAKHMNTADYLAFAESFSEQLKARRENEYFL
ncbi:MAG: 4Fe-4S binding protein [Clostridiales bacterium]|nr:4Fe-4S binding protein [Clostridiales bacterium]